MAIQDFTAGQVLTAAQMDALQANDYNQTVSNKTASYTLVAADKGTRVVMSNAGATTITVDDSLFVAGDTLFIQNIGAGTCTITAGTATVTTAGSLALAQWGGGTLYFTSASAAIFFSGGAPTYGVATGGSSSSITVGGINYTLLTFTSTGTLTVTRSGFFDYLLFSSGAGGGPSGSNLSGGGGGAGGVFEGQLYVAAGANPTITIGAGGASGTRGNISSIGSSFSLVGGMYGATFPDFNPILDTYAMACGGGGRPQGPTSGSVAINDGFFGKNGGSGGVSAANAAGGGGGTTGAGGANISTTGGAGGTGTDVSYFIGGSALFKGGGGGGGSSVTGGTGGSGVGGDGFSGNGSGASAGNNTASGGGGAGGTSGSGGVGGSGIVYIRFRV
jgi:hypothetical protein